MANKKDGFYYLNSKNSVRNRESVTSEIAYLEHPNDGKSWKTSGFERNGNQPITQKMKSKNNHVKSRLAVDYEYDSFPIGHPLNPFTNAFVIDFWGEYRGVTSKTEVGTYRGRVSYEDYISHINNIKDSDVLSHLRTFTDFYINEWQIYEHEEDHEVELQNYAHKEDWIYGFNLMERLFIPENLDRLYEYYRKTTRQLTQDYIANPENMPLDQIERLVHEVDPELRKMLENNLPSADPVIKQISTKFSFKTQNGLKILK